MLKRLAAGGAAVAVGIGVWGVAGQDNTTRDSSGQIVSQGQLGAFVTKVGDCFTGVSPDATTISTVNGVPCSSPHNWQVYFKATTNIQSFDTQALLNDGSAQCDAQVRNIAQTMSSDIYNEYYNAEFKLLVPTSQSWAKGDRAIDCLVGSSNNSFSDSFI